MHNYKAKDHWRYQKRDPNTGRWADATPGDLLDPSVPTTGLVQMVRTSKAPSSSDRSGIGREVDLPKFDVQANGRSLGQVFASLSRESRDYSSGSVKLWHYRKPGGRTSPGMSSQKQARDALLADVGHENKKPSSDAATGAFEPIARQGYDELGPGPGPGESMAESVARPTSKPTYLVSARGQGIVEEHDSLSEAQRAADFYEGGSVTEVPGVPAASESGPIIPDEVGLFDDIADMRVGTSTQSAGVVVRRIPDGYTVDRGLDREFFPSAEEAVASINRSGYEDGAARIDREDPNSLVNRSAPEELDPYDSGVEEIMRFNMAASAYSDLGGSVQDQMAEYLDALNNGGVGIGKLSEQEVRDLDLNPNAVLMIEDFLEEHPDSTFDMEAFREYDAMGSAVQEQMESVLNGEPFSEQNPNALEIIADFLKRGMGPEGNNIANDISDYLSSVRLRRKKNVDIQFYDAAFAEVELQMLHAGMKDSSEWTVRKLEIEEENAPPVRAKAVRDDSTLLARLELEEKAQIPDRGALRDSQFAIPDERRYPIPDEEHAKLALGRCKKKPEEFKVRAAVLSKFPDLKEYAEEVLD